MEVDQPAPNNVIHIGMVRVFGPVIPPSMQCQQLLDVLLPSMFISFLPKSPKMWTIQASLLSDCLWPNVSAVQKFLMPSVQGTIVVPKFKQRSNFLSLGYGETDEEAVELSDPFFSATPPLVVGKKRKARMSKSAHAPAI
jgi:hypothetical protein